ncbi:YidC/Oxa1 family membrane protein insertase [Yinghuangia seranimata]|uniref:YidC/Oxa1 family membrane protein insertase n=1 Tax=Yinghuangia seranimata TaxID=408067 RepID=UPI00248BEA4D|nr:membrane protein insertase YidC [Yinghuangia seranimata]MDI2126364.1 membrane protein insertase YidC [Yinghuangia seranimata]
MPAITHALMPPTASAATGGPIDIAGAIVTHLAHAVAPLCGSGSVAAAIVLLTMCVRVALIPLSYAQARADLARRALAPRVQELRRRHDRRRAKDPALLQRELAELHREAGVSPFAGCLPALAQAPVLFVLYRLFTSDGDLLGHTLAGAPLSAHPVAALSGPGTLVLVAVLLLTALVAYAHHRQAAANAAGAETPSDPTAATAAKAAVWLPFATVATVAVAPLAAGLYVVTSSAWSAAERPLLRRLVACRAGRVVATP